MKKAEAISILATSVRPREAKDRARYDEAVKMAIEALKRSETPNSSTDCISRQAAIDALDCINGAEEVLRALPSVQQETSMLTVKCELDDEELSRAIEAVKNAELELIAAQPEIIRCRNCKFASGDSRICMKFGHSPIGELDFCAWAERRTDE